ncbi:MAG TPA: GGDEF domain-containing protein [Steroidobacteraceae bacterium]|jgi:diguanylate cyclase (GGDEF)-like protein|nr:GGDEF domain-containing protein [Steroidobacteraceae bacterium]
MPGKDLSRAIFIFLLMAPWPFAAARAQSPTELLAQLETAVANEDEKAAQELWKRLAPEFEGLSRVDQGRYLVAQGLIQEDILRDIDGADQSFNRVISLLDASPPTQALADAYYERGYIKYIRTYDTAVYCPDREKAVALTRQLNTRNKLPKYLTALSYCYSDSPARLQLGLAVLNEAITLAETMQLSPSERGMIYNATSILYRRNQLYARAYEYSRLAYDQWNLVGDKSSLDTQLHNLLINAVGMGDLDKAEQHGGEMFALADAAPEFKDFRFFAALDSGQVALARDDFPRAIRLFEQARSEERNTEEAVFVAANRALLATAHFLNGDVDAALREAAAVARLPGYESLEASQTQFVEALRQYSGKHPVQAMQTLYAMHRAQQKRQWEFLANTTLDHAQRHDNRIQQYEKQLLENQVQIQQLNLAAQQRRQEASRLYLVLAAVVAISLGVVAWTLWRSRRRFITQARTDSLTGIANRRHFLERARQVARKNRNQPQTASVLVLDIDHFKLINDAHGHQAGDAAIRHVALQANACLGSEDVFGRIGGEEFAALLPGGDESAAWRVAEQIRKIVEQTPLRHHGEQIPITVSIGLMSGPLTSENIETLMQCADKVMYRAKNAGRNRSLAHADQFPDAGVASSAAG